MICDDCREQSHVTCMNFGFFGEVARNSCFCQHKTALGEASRGTQAANRSAESRESVSESSSADGVHSDGAASEVHSEQQGEESGSGSSLRVSPQAGQEVAKPRVYELPEDLFS